MKPPTFLVYFSEASVASADFRRMMWDEYAAAGAKYVILTDPVIRLIAGKAALAPTIRDEIAAAGLELLDAHAPFGKWENLSLAAEELRGSMIARHRLTLQIAADFGIRTITFHHGRIPFETPGAPAERFVANAKRSLDQLLPLAEQLGIAIAVENTCDPLTSAERLLHLMHHYRSPYLGICYDSGHANILAHPGDSPDSVAVKEYTPHGLAPEWDDRLLEKILPHVINCHLHDNDGVADQHRLPGNGNVDWPRVMALLAKAPRLRCIQDEAFPRTSDFSIRENCRVFDDLLHGIYPRQTDRTESE